MSEHPGAGWYADPTRRFEHRYWDGTAWTEHVSRAGATATDPVTPAAPVWQADAGRPTITNVKAVVSLVLSILWIGGLGSLAGLVLGVMARREIRRAEGGQSGDGVALAGIVIGALGLLATALVIVALAAFVTVSPPVPSGGREIIFKGLAGLAW